MFLNLFILNLLKLETNQQKLNWLTRNKLISIKNDKNEKQTTIRKK